MNSLVSLFLFFLAGPALAAETLEALEKRTGMAGMERAIQSADNRGFSRLPAKGYKNGLSGILQKHRVYPNPEYSFTSCGYSDKFEGQSAVPGCRVSIKVARRLADCQLEDTGIRIEYAIGLG